MFSGIGGSSISAGGSNGATYEIPRNMGITTRTTIGRTISINYMGCNL